MLSKLFKKEKLHIYTPVNGKVIAIEDVDDPVFSGKMMGEGIAVMPSGGDIYAPADGTVVQVAPTKHAIGIQTEDGTELLIHVGLETVSLKGEGFSVAVQAGEKVKVGDLLMKVDWDYIRAHAKSTIIPLVITNSQEGNKEFHFSAEIEGTAGKTVLITAVAK
ncbi:PTS glucose transporter subunit IIA [Bacillus sp. 1P06AnD]|uniref:PTS sugar transporter subunit IIA n=1 Tax=Bacillus sp. 1P06AnD TaxID=3132208 RepID=UPI0039A07921